MATVIKNKKEYDSGDVVATFNGVPTNVSEISYETDQEHQLNYTLNNEPTSWSRGKRNYSGSVTLMMSDARLMEQAAPGGDLLKIPPFEINVTFVSEFNEIVNDTITAKFMKQGREVTGDMGLSKQYDLFVMGIEYNNA